MGYSLGKKIRGRSVRRLQGGGGENEQWRRAANLIPLISPSTLPPFSRKDGGLRRWKKKMRKTKAEGK